MKGATITLPNGHCVENILFAGVCRGLRAVASLRGENATFDDNPECRWIGQQALREFWIKCVDLTSKISRASCKLLSQVGICNKNGFTTKDIRNIILSLTLIDDAGDIIMTIPPVEVRGSDVNPISAKIELNLGKAPN